MRQDKGAYRRLVLVKATARTSECGHLKKWAQVVFSHRRQVDQTKPSAHQLGVVQRQADF